jgi:uncharacterized DUF497 family protein
MKIECDPAKRVETLAVRGLDMADARSVFDGPTKTEEDLRHDYGERRFLTIGFLAGRMVLIAWTPRGEARRIISMRKANGREIARNSPGF